MYSTSSWLQFEQFIFNKTGCKPNPAKGINYNKNKKNCILRSVNRY